MVTPRRLSRFTGYACVVLGYMFVVIGWGAFVRASGSGAGCGEHWPLCNGQVVPRDPLWSTAVEFSHRLTSGLALVLTLVLLIWAFVTFPAKHAVRRWVGVSFSALIFEALIGAALVLFGLTGSNDSGLRAVVVALHLVNTFFLLGALVGTCWWSYVLKKEDAQSDGFWKGFLLLPLSLRATFILGVIVLILTGASGAVTALGDTLFPSSSLAHGIVQDFSATAHFLIGLRIWHPALAVLTACYLVYLGVRFQKKYEIKSVKICANLLVFLVVLQICVGFLNLYFLAPVKLSLLHLFIADVVWVAFVCLVFAKSTKSVSVMSVLENVSSGDK